MRVWKQIDSRIRDHLLTDLEFKHVVYDEWHDKVTKHDYHGDTISNKKSYPI